MFETWTIAWTIAWAIVGYVGFALATTYVAGRGDSEDQTNDDRFVNGVCGVFWPITWVAFVVWFAWKGLAAGVEAARILGIAYVPSEQPPSDPTPYKEWMRAQAHAFIDSHADALRAALAERKPA